MRTSIPHPGTSHLRLGGVPLPVVGPARTYVCGITPYDVTHLGHAATFVWADTAASVLRLTGVDVVSCRNVTDVDDVLTRAAAASGRYVDEFALSQEFLFERDMAALRVRRPTHEPRARAHIGTVVRLAAALLATGHAYESAGAVFFRGGAVPCTPGLSVDEAAQLVAAQGESGHDHREHPLDIAVWQPSTDEEPGWPSPWGRGRPGWHAECAAMALSVLGGSVDLLAGGADLAYPHHAYQAALIEAATGAQPFARSRLAVGTVHINGAKMAKSTGNLVLVADLLADASPSAVRLLLLDRAWREDWTYSSGALAAATSRLDELYAAAGRANAGEPEAATGEVTSALLDDLDVPRALHVAQEAGGDAARLALRVLALD